MAVRSRQPTEYPSYVSVLTSRIVEKFFIRLNTIDRYVSVLLIVSPVLGTLSGTGVSLEQLRRILRVHRIRTYLITQSPDSDLTKNAPGHRIALEILRELDFLEIRYNNSLHAKVYVCIGNEKKNSFALLGSGNMTKTSVERNIEVGVLIRSFSGGRVIVDELESWIMNKLRLHRDSELAKSMLRLTRQREV